MSLHTPKWHFLMAQILNLKTRLSMWESYLVVGVSEDRMRTERNRTGWNRERGGRVLVVLSHSLQHLFLSTRWQWSTVAMETPYSNCSGHNPHHRSDCPLYPWHQLVSIQSSRLSDHVGQQGSTFGLCSDKVGWGLAGRAASDEEVGELWIFCRAGAEVKQLEGSLTVLAISWISCWTALNLNEEFLRWGRGTGMGLGMQRL